MAEERVAQASIGTQENSSLARRYEPSVQRADEARTDLSSRFHLLMAVRAKAALGGLLILAACTTSSDDTFQIPDEGFGQVTAQEDSSLTVGQWSIGNEVAVGLSNIEIASEDGDLIGELLTSSDPGDVRVEILADGLGSLEDESAAPDTEREAQDDARAAGVGIWEKPWWRQAWDQTWPVIAFLGGSGFLLYGWTQYKLKRARRRVRLLLVGEAAAGKTALRIALTNRNPARYIFNESSSPTTRSNTRVGESPMMMGRYEVTPVVTDTAGRQPGEVIDKLDGFLDRRTILTLVLSPTPRNAASGSSFDTDYVKRQLAYCEIFMKAVLTSQKRRHVRMCLIFVSKFDLYCGNPPGSEAASAVLKQFKDAFRPHERAIKDACGQGIPLHVVYGSSVNGWGITKFKENIEGTFFPKAHARR